ncbi:HdeD family acid-resistance protein [Carnobacterium divergens]|uniref:HdeD family acid-resistance protein n=1 Tax=Carnobacterium divergens TaxID=2748 RepID=UPI0039AF4C91
MKNFFKTLLLLSGILMIVLGFWFIFNPSGSLKTAIILIGLLLAANGVIEIFSYIQERRVWNISNWVLFDGIASLVAGGFILFDTAIAQKTLVLLFAIWVLFSGIMRLMTAVAMKNFPGWTWILTLGVIAVIVAIISFFSPILIGIGIGLILGAFFIIQGFSCIMVYLAIKNYH